ncbi:MAG: AzlD domain-containing protein [Candidatus Sedimenticola sp. 20ELBAFRAG]
MIESSTSYLLAVIAVMTGATFITRLIPFILLKDRHEHPVLEYLGRYTPPVIMTILVLYSLKGVDPGTAPHGVPELIAIGVTLVLHQLRGNALLSIFSGTGVYMYLLQSGLLS